MKKQLKKVPDFQNEDEEREFWSTHSTTDYVDWSKAYRPTEPFPNLKPSNHLLVFNIPEDEVENFDSLAKKYHITKDALVQRFVVEGLRREQGRARA